MNLPLRPADLPPTSQAVESLMRRRWSVAEIEDLVRAGIILEDERFELIGGEVVPMSPKGLRHERLKQALNEFWTRNLPPAFKVIQETTLRVTKDTFFEPDFVFFRTADGLASLSPQTVLLTVEVADSSLEFDLKRKSNLYAAHGLREAWVIDADTLITHIRAKPGAEGYAEKREVARHEAIALPFAPEVAIALQDLVLP